MHNRRALLLGQSDGKFVSLLSYLGATLFAIRRRRDAGASYDIQMIYRISLKPSDDEQALPNCFSAGSNKQGTVIKGTPWSVAAKVGIQNMHLTANA